MTTRSATSYWIGRSSFQPVLFSPLVADVSCDVAIVGAGVSGAMAAQHLAQRGLSVRLFDRKPPATSSTAACTAMIQYELDQPLTALMKRYGPAVATQAYRTSRQSLEWMQELVGTLDDTCDLGVRPSLYLARERAELDPMRDECDARRIIGLDASWADEHELADRWRVDRPGAIVSDKSLELDPHRLTQSLLRDAVAHGAVVHSPVEVASYGWGSPRVTLKTTEGVQITAKHVIVASGYETPAELRQNVGRMVTTFAAVSKPTDLSSWRRRQLMWEWGDNYHYARTMPGDRVIFGGGDEPMLDPKQRDALIPTKAQQLAAYVRSLVPGLNLEIDTAWAGTFATSDDGLPYIGPVAAYPGALFALGYGGNGVTFSLMAARIIAGIVCDDAELRRPMNLFRFDR